MPVEKMPQGYRSRTLTGPGHWYAATLYQVKGAGLMQTSGKYGPKLVLGQPR